jgi:high-affinity iron transporter
VTDEALGLIDSLYPDEWKDAGATADFDVISATLDRLEGAIAAGQFSQAEQARLEAYAFFEFGPEQRLRGLANDLFVEVEGLFWYGADGLPGLAQLVKRKAAAAEVAETRQALDAALADAEQAVGAGPTSTFAVVSNTAVIVFREGLEAVLILAALMAGMTGAQAALRKPLLAGAAAAFVASVATWGIAETVLGSLSRYGEKLEAVVSLLAIGVLLLILNWFYHRVYWSEHLAGLHGKKKKILGIGVGVAAAQLVGLVALGFTSVYREGFETVLFLQAIVLEAGAGTVLVGVGIGLAATLAVGFLTIRLQRKLPHKKMLIATGLLILWVLVVMVGTTVQTLQVVGWVPVTPVEGLRLPYWAGLWLGVFPTWEGLLAQGAAIVFVLGSYVLAERLRMRKRRAILDKPSPATSS